MQTSGNSATRKRLFDAEPLGNQAQHGHLPRRPLNPEHTGFCLSQFFNVVCSLNWFLHGSVFSTILANALFQLPDVSTMMCSEPDNSETLSKVVFCFT